MTREDVIKKALAEGKDPHVATAAWEHGIPEESVTKGMRMAQKTANHWYCYRGSDLAINNFVSTKLEKENEQE